MFLLVIGDPTCLPFMMLYSIMLQGYYGPAHSLARTARQMSRQLWKPVTDAHGIPFDTVHSFTVALTQWREQFLTRVGVPRNFKGDWDFVSVSIQLYPDKKMASHRDRLFHRVPATPRTMSCGSSSSMPSTILVSRRSTIILWIRTVDELKK